MQLPSSRARRGRFLRTALVGLLLAGPLLAAQDCGPPEPVHELVEISGFAEPHTPGAPGVVPDARVVELLGPDPDLNRVSYVRTSLPTLGATPRIVFIFIPGFLGGAANFRPLAEQLVTGFGGSAEVWAVDRRPNQLEDRRGARHALAGTPDAILEGAQFYFPDLDLPPAGNFPGPEDSDVDQDGVVDPPFSLPDGAGGSQPFIELAQDEVRFMAHWGVDTYARDWKILVEQARALVGEDGLVLFGGHSQGTSWTGLFAAYDFDPGPGVDAAHELVDGLILLEGGGAGDGANVKPTLEEYENTVTALEGPGGGDVYLGNLFLLVNLRFLGAGAEVTALAGIADPDAPSIVQRTVFGKVLSFLIPAPATNRAIVGLFLDDDFSSVAAFRASMGFSDNGSNVLGGNGIYTAPNEGIIRTWKNIDVPQPSCPPNDPAVSPGCAIEDHGPQPGPGDPQGIWGVEAEVTDLDDVLALQVAESNFVEWYFAEGRPNLDFQYGRDSSALGDESLLATTQNDQVDLPVLAIGGSNGLTPTAASFANYLASIATAEADQRIEIIEGHAHLDVITASGNPVAGILRDWANGLLQEKLLEGF